jgi:hypothetical protein
MNLARLASVVHKWLALLIGIQIVFWVVSGLFFTIYPIEQVRSEHLIRPAAAARPLDLSKASSLAQIRNVQGQAPTKLTLEHRAHGDVVLAEFASGPPQLFDASTLRRLSPIDAATAVRIARAHVTLTAPPDRVERIASKTTEYRGTLPAWRVQFPEDGLAVFVAADTGTVTARRSDLWRVYDTLWALHIMDWQEHEDFNHPLIIIVTAVTLLSVIAGIVLIPYRVRFRMRRTRAEG